MSSRSAAKQQELNPDDLVFEPWGAGFPMMDGSVTNQWGVRVTHKPTGETGESDHYKSQLRNKEEALAVLRHRLAVSRG